MPTTLDPAEPTQSTPETSPPVERAAPAPSDESPRVATAPEDDAANLVLLKLKQEAEVEVVRLRTELAEVQRQLLNADLTEEKANVEEKGTGNFKYERAAKLRAELPSPVKWDAIRKEKAALEVALKLAEQRLDTERATIRQHELAAIAAGGRPPSKAKRELAELLEAGGRILPEFADKLDRFVHFFHANLNGTDWLTGDLCAQRVKEFEALRPPLSAWIRKLSAVLEEGRLTEVQRMELHLRLTDLEGRFVTASRLASRFGTSPRP